MNESEIRLAVADAPNALLPARYEAAKTALAECESVDECSTWAKKAAALASYARQADDKTLEATAVRIRARTIRRCGELLREIPAKAHGSPSGAGAQPHHSERARAATDAGMSRDQALDAVRIAKIPAREFETAVESPSPATIEWLAQLGTAKKIPPLFVDLEGRDPKEFNHSLHLRAHVNDLAVEARATTPALLVRGCVSDWYPQLRESARFLSKWTAELLVALENLPTEEERRGGGIHDP